jgi:hypothetical protein
MTVFIYQSKKLIALKNVVPYAMPVSDSPSG